MTGPDQIASRAELREMSPQEQREFDLLLELCFVRLETGKSVSVPALLDEMSALGGREHPDLLVARAELVRERNPRQSQRLLERATVVDPQHARACHALGQLYEDLGDFDAMVEQFQRVHELDGQQLQAVEVDPKLRERISERVRSTLEGLPDSIAQRVGQVPIMIESRPTLEQVREGIDPRLLGLFEGQSERVQRGIAVEGQALGPTRVVVYEDNLLAAFDDDEEMLDEVEVTVMHELAHYLGLDEDEVAELGLE